MKILLLISAPTLILWITCLIVGASWYWFLIVWPIGLAFGFLLTVAVFWALGVKSRRKSNLKKTWE